MDRIIRAIKAYDNLIRGGTGGTMFTALVCSMAFCLVIIALLKLHGFDGTNTPGYLSFMLVAGIFIHSGLTFWYVPKLARLMIRFGSWILEEDDYERYFRDY